MYKSHTILGPINSVQYIPPCIYEIYEEHLLYGPYGNPYIDLWLMHTWSLYIQGTFPYKEHIFWTNLFKLVLILLFNLIYR